MQTGIFDGLAKTLDQEDVLLKAMGIMEEGSYVYNRFYLDSNDSSAAETVLELTKPLVIDREIALIPTEGPVTICLRQGDSPLILVEAGGKLIISGERNPERLLISGADMYGGVCFPAGYGSVETEDGQQSWKETVSQSEP